MSIEAQEVSKHALGVRLGDNDGFGAEVSYQLGLGGANRLELDLGWRDFKNGSAIKVTGLYEFVFNLDKGFNWYVGPGAGFAYVNYDNDIITKSENNSDTYLVLAGVLGIEYDFDIPILISLDLRPEIGFGEISDDLDLDIGLGIRYQF